MKSRFPVQVNKAFQSGAALVVALVFLIAMTLIGLASIGDNQLQQRMTYGSAESNLAFQAAETALSAGENWISRQANRPDPDCVRPCNTSNSVWNGDPNLDTTISPEVIMANIRNRTWWTNQGRKFGFDFTDAGAVALPSQEIPWLNSSNQPRYVIEQFRDAYAPPTAGFPQNAPQIWYYQITARGQGNLPNQTAIVQSIVAREY
jgi:type IV pilus assembly protein PilX